MSGGVDSSVAAALLKQEGYDVTGVHMICWEGCENNQDKQDAMRVAAHLGIPFLVWDFRKEYREAVYDYMVREYMAGRTPNPDVMCNNRIKFGVFLEKALENGADYIATGHYVRLMRKSQITSIKSQTNSKSQINPKSQNSKHERGMNNPSLSPFPLRRGGGEGVGSLNGLFQAKDFNKDQSYFLWTLTQDKLKHCLFPIGDYLKNEIREIARKANLPVAEKKDSQGLCFVGKVDFGEFLRGAIPEQRGAVIDSAGKKIGEHDGAYFYTIGQRHGLAIGGQTEPIYVAERNIFTNTLTIARGGADPILYKNEIEVSDLNWISGEAPGMPFECFARIRYRQPPQRCMVNYQLSNVKCSVGFDDRQRAVAPGQSIVFYKENGEMLGGGIIKYK